jgi:hypothetical protein
MLRRVPASFGLVWPLLLLQTAAAAERLPPANQWIAKDALVVLEVTRPKPLLDLALSDKMTAAITSAPAYQKVAAQPGFQQFRGGVKYMEAALRTDWRTGLHSLVDGGVTLAVYPSGALLVVVDAQSPEMLGQLHEVIVNMSKADAKKKNQPSSIVSEKYRGAILWSFGGGESHAIVGGRLLLSNRADAVKAALDQRETPKGLGLASVPAYQAAKQAAPADAVATVFANLAVLKQNPQLKEALASSGNPLAALLFADVQESLRESNWLALGLSVEGESLALRATMDGKPSGGTAAAFAQPKPGEGAFPQLAVPRRIAAMSIYRDLRGFYAAKDKLFPERTSGLIFFENMMGIFFTGRDLTDEVLAETAPEVRFVVAEQQYDPAAGVPQLKLPAFAAVFRLRHAKEFGQVTEEAWQKALGLINFTRGQKAEPGLILDKDTHSGTRYSLAYFSTAGIKDKKDDVRFNFRPAIARPGDYLVLSSTDGLAKDLIDALKKETAGTIKAVSGAHSMVELDAARLASILTANRAGLVRNNMVEKGSTQAEAEGQIDMLTTLVQYLGHASLAIGGKEGKTQAKLTVKVAIGE